MSKMAILGDIHGNIDALRATLGDIKEESVDKLLITGDLVGYYYHPDKVLEDLDGWDYELVQGNHEGMLGTILSWSNERKKAYRQEYGTALEYTARELLCDEEIEYLTTLPYRKDLFFGGRSILLCHGSSWDRDEYIYPDVPDDVLRRCAAEKHDVVIMGHTHYQMLKNINSTVIINPGSVGQPRDGKCGAFWAMLDLDNLSVECRRTNYNPQNLITEIKDRDPDVPYLIEILGGK